jgi:hypothetical protein
MGDFSNSNRYDPIFLVGESGAVLTFWKAHHLIAVVSDVVDIFNGTSGEWTSARLSVARYGLAATSLSTQGLAFFAGGFEGPDLAYYEVTTMNTAGRSIVVGTHNMY